MRRNENFGRENWMTINRVCWFWHLSEKALCYQSQHFPSRLLGLLNNRHGGKHTALALSLSQLKQCSSKPYAWVRILRENLLVLCVHSLNFYVVSARAPGKIFSLPQPGPGPRQNRNPRPGPRSITTQREWYATIQLRQSNGEKLPNRIIQLQREGAFKFIVNKNKKNLYPWGLTFISL